MYTYIERSIKTSINMYMNNAMNNAMNIFGLFSPGKAAVFYFIHGINLFMTLFMYMFMAIPIDMLVYS